MVGGVITKDMEENHVYAGVPAKDITEKAGPQYAPVDELVRAKNFEKLKSDFYAKYGIRPGDFNISAVDDLDVCKSTDTVTYFDLRNRQYLPARSENEYKFMKYVLYEKAKFVPRTKSS